MPELELGPVWLSLQLATVTVLVLLVIATPLAWWLAFTRSASRTVVEAVVAMPLVLPPTVLGFYLLILLGPAGLHRQPVARAHRHDADVLVRGPRHRVGDLLVSVRRATAAGARSRPSGRRRSKPPRRSAPGRLDAFLQRRLARWRCAATCPRPCLTFAHTLGEFGVVLMVGGNIPGSTKVISIAIYEHVETIDYAQAHILSAGLLVFSFIVLVVGLLAEPAHAARARLAAAMSTLSLNVALDRPGFALRVGIDLELTGITALFGPSGSGKTTVLRIIAGLEHEASGTVAFDGETWQSGETRVPTHRRRVGYVFQDGRLFPHLTVAQNLEFALRRSTQGPRPSIDLEEAIEALDLTSLLARRTPSLSGGEQQRVAIARALLTSPRLLLMDEPLSSLDVKRKREILPHIETLPEIFGVPVLYVTHNVDEVARLASDVVLLAEGRVVAHGSVAEVFERTDSGTADGRARGRRRAARASSGARRRHRDAARRNAATASADGDGASRHARGRYASTRATLRSRPCGRRSSAFATSSWAVSGSIEPGINMNVELLLDVDGEHLRARITRDALEELELSSGREVFALVKSVALESSLGS